MIKRIDKEKYVLYIGSLSDRDEILKHACKYKHHNISHSGEYFICAFSDDKIGCDIEKIREIDYAKISKRFFTKMEKDEIESKKKDEDKLNAFFNIWVKKESYIKRDGRGMEIPLDSFSVYDEYNLNIKYIEENVDDNYKCVVCI